MSERKRKIKGPDGVERDAIELGFRNTGEYFNEYLLDDGSVIRFKAVVTSVLRVEGVYDAAGAPVYLVESQNVLKVSPTDDMRKDGG